MTTQSIVFLLLIAAVIIGVHFLEKKLDRKPKDSAGKASGESRPAESTSGKAVEPAQLR